MNEDGSAEQHLAADSDGLLSELRGLREQEERKRRTTISSPEFHELADDVERRARQIWRTAADERATGNEARPASPTTTDEVDAALRRGDGAGRELEGSSPTPDD